MRQSFFKTFFACKYFPNAPSKNDFFADICQYENFME